MTRECPLLDFAFFLVSHVYLGSIRSSPMWPHLVMNLSTGWFSQLPLSVWLRRLMADLGVGQQFSTTIFTDSQSALAVSRNLVFHARTKHIEVQYHYVRERLSAREINLAYVPT